MSTMDENSKVNVIAPLNTPIDLAERIGPWKLVDRGSRVIGLQFQAGKHIVSFDLSKPGNGTGAYFVKDPFGAHGDLSFNLRRVLVFSPQTSDVDGEYLSQFAAVRDVKAEIIVNVAVTGKITAADNMLTITGASVKLQCVIGDGGMHLYPPAHEFHQIAQAMVDNLQLTHCVVEVPTWNKPDLSGLAVLPEKLIFANGTHEELMEWIASASRQMQDPQLSAQGEVMWLEDAVKGGERYHIYNDWATKPMTYQVIKE